MNLVLGARERWLNIALFILFALGTVDSLRSAEAQGTLGWVDLSFAVQNAVFCCMVLLRHPAKAVDDSLLRQAVAMAAFFSGLLFFGEPLTGEGAMRTAGQITVVTANILAVICLVTLGKSFGILVACRELRVTGVYSLVRHPMFSSDLLLRLGYVMAHPSLKTGVLLVLCCGLYYWRAVLEERFLVQNTAYADYMRRVPHRFIPGLF